MARCFNKVSLTAIYIVLMGFLFLVIAPDVANAQNLGRGGGAGGSLLTDVQNILVGQLGTVIGLGISLFGLWVWLAQQSSWGLLIVIAGAAITAFPGLYKGLTQGFKAAFGTVGTGASAR
jgi:hypothetical protein